MQYYPSLKELLSHSPKSKRLYDSFSPGVQLYLQEQRESIHIYADLEKTASLFP